jgi:PhoPQ-activated pathogenicity-related protein
VYNAMVKSAVMALTTIESFVKTLGLSANQFMVAGASKRGWWVT